MKMQNAEMKFVTFDAQDVIATSGPLGKPLAYVFGSALISGESNFNLDPNAVGAVDALDYLSEDVLTNKLKNKDIKNNYFEITKAKKLDTGYGVSFDIENSLNYKPDNNASIGGTFDVSDDLRAWLITYLNQ